METGMARKIQSVKVWTLALTVAGTVAMAAQQPAPPQPGGPEPAAQAAGPQPQRVETYIVGQAKPPVDPGTGLKDLTLEQAIQIALENNLDLKVAKMNPQIQDYALVQARAIFRPTVTASFNQNHASQPNTDVTQVVKSILTQQQNYVGNFNQNLAFWGASYSAQYTSGRATNNQPTQTRNPNLSASTRFQYTQPILANFKTDSNRTTIKTQAIQRQIIDIQLLQTIENTKASVRTAYWALRRAIEQIEIQKRALDLSQRLYEDNKTKVEIGTMAPIDIVQNESTVASNEQALLNAKIQWQTAELALKRLIVNGTDDDLNKQTINPTEQPPLLEQVSVDIPKAVAIALDQRTDIQQQKKSLESSLMNLELRKNATLPSLNLTGSYQLQGQGGDTYSFNRVTLVRTFVSEGGYGDALTMIGNFDQPTWTFGANFTYPLGMQAARASLAQSQIQYEQAKANLKVQELTVSTDVTNAGLAVQNSYLQLLAARKSSEAAARNAEAEQTRFDNGMSNNYNVALALQDLTNKRLSELNAIIAYVNAIAEFERKQRIGGGASAGGGIVGGAGGQ
jgi:outer membrane protein